MSLEAKMNLNKMIEELDFANIPESLKNEIGKFVKTLTKQCVEKALGEKLMDDDVKVIRKRKDIPIPFIKNHKLDGCECIVSNRGLMTQCGKEKVDELHCKKCLEKAKKHYYADRNNVDLYKFEMNGKKPTPYVEVLNEMGYTIEEALKHAETMNIEIPEEHVSTGARAKRSRKGDKDKKERQPRALSGYQLFNKTIRSEITATNFAEISKIVSSKWKELSEDEKARYSTLAKAEFANKSEKVSDKVIVDRDIADHSFASEHPDGCDDVSVISALTDVHNMDNDVDIVVDNDVKIVVDNKDKEKPYNYPDDSQRTGDTVEFEHIGETPEDSAKQVVKSDDLENSCADELWGEDLSKSNVEEVSKSNTEELQEMKIPGKLLDEIKPVIKKRIDAYLKYSEKFPHKSTDADLRLYDLTKEPTVGKKVLVKVSQRGKLTFYGFVNPDGSLYAPPKKSKN